MSDRDTLIAFGDVREVPGVTLRPRPRLDVYRIGFNAWQCTICGGVCLSLLARWHRAAKCLGFWRGTLYRVRRWWREVRTR